MPKGKLRSEQGFWMILSTNVSIVSVLKGGCGKCLITVKVSLKKVWPKGLKKEGLEYCLLFHNPRGIYNESTLLGKEQVIFEYGQRENRQNEQEDV